MECDIDLLNHQIYLMYLSVLMNINLDRVLGLKYYL